MTTEQLAAFKQFGDRVSRDGSVMNLIASDSREAREMSSRLATTTTQAERAEAAGDTIARCASSFTPNQS